MAQPFLSIAITTYNRHDLLRETLNSILCQEFGDFEVIVGNDYTEETLTGELLGISDPRIRFLNHPKNLREVGNMNALLAAAGGRYFTWLFDDDLYEPGFLQTAHDALEKAGFPDAFFPSYRDLRVADVYRPSRVPAAPVSLLTGREFLDGYFSGAIKTVSTCGLFDTDRLRRKVGGVEELCDSAIGLYCEYLFLVRCGLLDRIAYMPAPFVLFRAHEGSWSESNNELEKYVKAGRELVRRCGEVLRQPGLADRQGRNLRALCRLHLVTYAYRSARLEVARKQFGAGGVARALTRHWRESASIKEAFLGQGGEDTLGTSLAFLRVNARCSLIIVLQIFYYLYWNLKQAAAPSTRG